MIACAGFRRAGTEVGFGAVFHEWLPENGRVVGQMGMNFSEHEQVLRDSSERSLTVRRWSAWELVVCGGG